MKLESRKKIIARVEEAVGDEIVQITRDLANPHDYPLVEDLHVEINRAIAGWAGRLVLPEEANLPYTKSIFECQGQVSCASGGSDDDGHFDPKDLYWMDFIIVEDTEYRSGWYCDGCIMEIHPGTNFMEIQKRMTLETEYLRRTQPDGAKKE